MSGTLNANYVQADVGTNLYVNTGLNSGNVIIGTLLAANTISSNTGSSLTLQSNNTTALTIDTSQNATFTGYTSTLNTFGYKNRLMNGDMRIWQRGTSSSSAGYLADRWQLENTGTYSQSTDAPAGFAYSCSVAVTSATTYGVIKQKIEALNCIDLNGATVTLSFWVKNLTGATAMYASLYYPTASDNYSSVTQIQQQSFTAIYNVWTKYTLTYTNLPSGVLNGLQVYIFSADASTGPSYRITGLQLEKGPLATPFDYRPYGTELALCQRYCWVNTPATNSPMTMGGVWNNSTTFNATVQFPVPMRASPSFSYLSAVSNYGVVTNGVVTPSALSSYGASTYSIGISATSSGQTAGYGGYIQNQSAGPWNFTFNAEL
jgi:hypothetical protein